MNIVSLNCTSCGAPIQVPPDIDQFVCAHCGTSLLIQRGEGYVALKIAEQLSEAISASGQQTRAAISEGTHVTQAELKRLQQKQDLSIAEMQLSNIQAEIRLLERLKKSGTVKKQLRQLREEEANLKKRVRMLHIQGKQSTGAQYGMTQEERNAEQVKQGMKEIKSSFQTPFAQGCISGCITYVGMAFVLMILAMPFDAIFFKWTFEYETGDPGPIAFIGVFVALIFGTIAFFYRWREGVSIWVPIKTRLQGRRKQARNVELLDATAGQPADEQVIGLPD